jgi:DNA (cytosine-5)-methyltransferase 1
MPVYQGPRETLGDILSPENQVSDEFYIQAKDLPVWQYLKGSKKEIRTAKSGYQYTYSEGALQFPDSLDKPSRTILTGESGRGASRTKHVIQQDGRLRRLTPDELDQLQMFPKGWTDTGMSDSQRSFCMGNALVTRIPHQIGKYIAMNE